MQKIYKNLHYCQACCAKCAKHRWSEVYSVALSKESTAVANLQQYCALFVRWIANGVIEREKSLSLVALINNFFSWQNLYFRVKTPSTSEYSFCVQEKCFFVIIVTSSQLIYCLINNFSCDEKNNDEILKWSSYLALPSKLCKIAGSDKTSSDSSKSNNFWLWNFFKLLSINLISSFAIKLCAWNKCRFKWSSPLQCKNRIFWLISSSQFTENASQCQLVVCTCAFGSVHVCHFAIYLFRQISD